MYIYVYQGFRLNLGKKQDDFFEVFFDHNCTPIFFEAAGEVAKTGSSQNLNCQIKLNLSKSIIHSVITLSNMHD